MRREKGQKETWSQSKGAVWFQSELALPLSPLSPCPRLPILTLPHDATNPSPELVPRGNSRGRPRPNSQPPHAPPPDPVSWPSSSWCPQISRHPSCQPWPFDLGKQQHLALTLSGKSQVHGAEAN